MLLAGLDGIVIRPPRRMQVLCRAKGRHFDVLRRSKMQRRARASLLAVTDMADKTFVFSAVAAAVRTMVETPNST
jgi:hypothetical protein